MKIKHILFTSATIILSTILIIQNIKIQFLQNTLNKIEYNYSNLNTNLNNNLTNLNISLTNLNTNITNLKNPQMSDPFFTYTNRNTKITPTMSQPLFPIESNVEENQ